VRIHCKNVSDLFEGLFQFSRPSNMRTGLSFSTIV
jgi:hypothetical protein